jgi:hypothetical protein
VGPMTVATSTIMIRLGPASYAGRGKKRGLGTEVETVYVLRIGWGCSLLIRQTGIPSERTECLLSIEAGPPPFV